MKLLTQINLAMGAMALSQPNWGRNIATWLANQAAWLVLVAGVIVAAGFGIKRNTVGCVVALVITVVLFVLLLDVAAGAPVLRRIGDAVVGIIGL
jgi:hypothetical protein